MRVGLGEPLSNAGQLNEAAGLRQALDTDMGNARALRVGQVLDRRRPRGNGGAHWRTIRKMWTSTTAQAMRFWHRGVGPKRWLNGGD
jgi:hypothetical protein